MTNRKEKFIAGLYYHVYNRGVDKRAIVVDEKDRVRLFKSLSYFNTVQPIGSIFEFLHGRELEKSHEKLVDFIAYCLNDNHFHFILRPRTDSGIQKFMHRLGTGYTNYFNEKYKRSGVLFQGKFKAKTITDNNYLLHVSAYVNLNNKVHAFGSSTPKTIFSSWKEYCSNCKNGFCNKEIILDQFRSVDEYRKFALSSLKDIQTRKNLGVELPNLFLQFNF